MNLNENNLLLFTFLFSMNLTVLIINEAQLKSITISKKLITSDDLNPPNGFFGNIQPNPMVVILLH